MIFPDVCNADLNPYGPQCIASVLKKFLRELPDPVIPVQWYDKFLEASSECFTIKLNNSQLIIARNFMPFSSVVIRL